MSKRAELPEYLKIAGRVSRILSPLQPETRRTVLDFLLKSEDEERLEKHIKQNGSTFDTAS